MVLETASITRRFFARILAGAAAINVRLPPCAPGNPPETGLSIKSIPDPAIAAPISRASVGLIVAVSRIVPPFSIEATKPFSPRIISLAWVPFITMTNTVSLARPISAKSFANCPPIASKATLRCSNKSRPITENPFLMRFLAKPLPISPMPTIPTFFIFILP